ncbi:hypothetical protein P8C59_000366 [Phyllachora maydis]|uniref:Alpha-l-rhamnosidase c n=1 Tax=Phyllachora maydis TaxID=1825666 RepID=A0AAD9HX79_9PEZI|nr:hypothetical protein P8C59_000366 [Phyllachora maydis]
MADADGVPTETIVAPPPPGASEDAALPNSSTTEVTEVGGTEPLANGYHFPPKYDWKESTWHGLSAFWKFFWTPLGFFWAIYGLNVVAWGGMLFLLLCNAAPAMCVPDCNDINSPRRVWVEIDSQILTGLFCVTGFGLIPWRFRDLWYLLKYRVRGQHSGLRTLAGIHRGWYRLPGSQDLPSDVGPDKLPDDTGSASIALPPAKTPDAPRTGTRAPPTPTWKMDFVIWTMVLNTFAQAGLCGIMWGMNRFDRPSWSTGFLVGVACIIAMVGGLVMFVEGNKVKAIEGVACSARDLAKLQSDKTRGILHYNNIKDKKPKEKQADAEKAGVGQK